MWLIAGLGNPGSQYTQTWHNCGFMTLDVLAQRNRIPVAKSKFKGEFGQGTILGEKVVLLRPHTFMNLSGQSVQGLMHFYKLPLENLLIAHDDLDLPVGTIRIRPDGGSAGQKGMTSILERLGTDAFARIRLGIGRPPGQMQAPDYVLQDFSNSDQVIVSETLNRAVDAALEFINNGLDAAMNKYNGVVS